MPNPSSTTWRIREYRISYQRMLDVLPGYQRHFDRARMKLSDDLRQPANPVDRLYDIEICDTRIDDREARHRALAEQGWQYAGTQKKSAYARRRHRIQEKFGEHLIFDAVSGVTGEALADHVEVFARKSALDLALAETVSEHQLRQVQRDAQAAAATFLAETTDEHRVLSDVQSDPKPPFLRPV